MSHTDVMIATHLCKATHNHRQRDCNTKTLISYLVAANSCCQCRSRKDVDRLDHGLVWSIVVIIGIGINCSKISNPGPSSFLPDSNAAFIRARSSILPGGCPAFTQPARLRCSTTSRSGEQSFPGGRRADPANRGPRWSTGRA